MDDKNIDKYIFQQRQWLDMLNNSLSHMEKLKLGQISITEERWKEIINSHKNVASAIAFLSKLTNESN